MKRLVSKADVYIDEWLAR